ncbi:hypothetical protein AB0N77_20365 [Streptomyces misionensis]|uniref:hypothetical protein n=1 Tax=Streptomyces misionensis TaxID=67331 RepID=UPI0034166604
MDQRSHHRRLGGGRIPRRRLLLGGVLGDGHTLGDGPQGQVAGVLVLNRAGQQPLHRDDPIPGPPRPRDRTGPAGRQAQRRPHRRSPAGAHRRGVGKDGAHRRGADDVAVAQREAQQGVQGRAAGRGHLLRPADRYALPGRRGQPHPDGLRVDAGDVFEERRGRPPPASRPVRQQQMRGVLGQDAQPHRRRAGTEEVRLGTRVRPAGELGRLVRARLRQGGELKDPGRALRHRHEQLPGRVQKLGVEQDSVVGSGRTAVQDARRQPVDETPHVQCLLLGCAQRLARQMLDDAAGPAPVVAARAVQLAAQHLGRRRHRFPHRARRLRGSRRIKVAGGGRRASTAPSRSCAAACRPTLSGAPGSFSSVSAADRTHAAATSAGRTSPVPVRARRASCSNPNARTPGSPWASRAAASKSSACGRAGRSPVGGISVSTGAP